MPGPDPDGPDDDSSKSSGRDKGKAIGKGLRDMGSKETDRANAISESIRPVAYKNGGKIRKLKRTSKVKRTSRRSRR